VAGSYSEVVFPDGTTTGGGLPNRLKSFENATNSVYANSNVNIHFIKKKIKFNRLDNPWLADYKVDISFVNSVPQSADGQLTDHGDESNTGEYLGHWIGKGFDEFTIYIAFCAMNAQVLSWGTGGGAHPDSGPPTSNFTPAEYRDGGTFSCFVVPVEDILWSNTSPISQTVGYVGNPRMGKCTYPTIMWTITGIPQADTPYFYGNLNNTNPTISIKS